MRTSAQCLNAGFFRRSLDEFKRLSKFGTLCFPYKISSSSPSLNPSRWLGFHAVPSIADPEFLLALSMEGLKAPTKPLYLLDFTDSDAVEACKTFSDASTGGFSNSILEHVPSCASEPAHAKFYGSISIDLPPNRPDIQRTGYAAWRNLDRPSTIFGKSYWDIDRYTYLALRIKSDGRKYLVNVQTDSVVATDLHQHRLFAKTPGQWETVLIKWHEFVRTNHGFVVEPQTEMLRQKVRTVGIGLTNRIPGPFELCISRVWATNGVKEEQENVDQDEKFQDQ
ncbi:MAG: Complex I intermediate-associated protein 30, mitochondrial [Cirrosporium novae-zelandiae]|nr:MAG: Complex I intermediate-associated protein 30, mitochondrial [Cirrosporium novae-zelandiae]